MSKKVLIAYGTRYGATEGVAEKIGEILENNDITVDIINIKTALKEDIPSFDDYDGILAASGIKIGQWTKDVKKFISKKKDELNGFNGKFGFFVCSNFSANSEKYEEAKKLYTTDALAKLGITKKTYTEAFGGLVDLTEESRMGWLDKKILKAVAKRELPEGEELSDYIDLRDWKQVEQFASAFLELL